MGKHVPWQGFAMHALSVVVVVHLDIFSVLPIGPVRLLLELVASEFRQWRALGGRWLLVTGFCSSVEAAN
jgi:hypothetical protein